MSEEIIRPTLNFGEVRQASTFWNDLDDFGEKELLKMKIIKIKVYTGLYQMQTVIVGISTTFRNVVTGEIRVIDHIGSLDYTDFKEFVIDNNNYLTDFHIRLPENNEYISQIGYCTRWRNFFVPEVTSVGEESNTDKFGKDYIIIGTFGCFDQKLDATGVLYASKTEFIKRIMFTFFLLRHKSKNDSKFEEKWDKDYKNLDIEYQYIWRLIKLPNLLLLSIFKYYI